MLPSCQALLVRWALKSSLLHSRVARNLKKESHFPSLEHKNEVSQRRGAFLTSWWSEAV